MGGGSYPSAEVQSVYSTAPADWAISVVDDLFYKWDLSTATSIEVVCGLQGGLW